MAAADPDRILSALNPSQREAATATRGPVAILAGAGTGKTTTITHRIAYQVVTQAFRADQILAVTFTEKAASELKRRLKTLGVEGVEARTFHGAAMSQLSRLWQQHTGQPVGDILDHKAPLIASLANALPPPHRFLPRRELANEIEWAKNRMVTPDAYPDEVRRTGHEPPIPVELMQRLYAGYERRKQAMKRLDFEDMLGRAVSLLTDFPAAADAVRERFAAFTVDEYQDVNPLQQRLLECWLGGRDELCVVGDDYQTIYGFTGASPSYLLGFRDRYPRARLVRLEENYRSTPEVLRVANALARRMGGFEKTLRASKPSGPSPVIRAIRDEDAEVAFVVREIERLHARDAVPYEEMAVLYRINARSEPYEEALARARIPYQVRDGAFLLRPGPRSVLARLRRESGPAVPAVTRATSAVGFVGDGDASLEAGGVEEATRQADLARMRALAEEFDHRHPEGEVAAFVAELVARFSREEDSRGVNLMTYHRAKGLEFDAVFLPRLLDGELPFRQARAHAPEDEERRLFYVGITRARRHLYVTWPMGGRFRRSGFVEELGAPGAEPSSPPAKVASGERSQRATVEVAADASDLFEGLKRWRRERASTDGVPAYVIFHDATLREIAESKPRTTSQLLGVSGVGPAKIERYGREVLEIVASHA